MKLNSETVWEMKASRQIKHYCSGPGENLSSVQSQKKKV